MKTKLPELPRTYTKDTNLLSFMFLIARSDHLLGLFLKEIKFIRDHPLLTEEEVRQYLEFDSVPAKALQ